MYRLDFWRCVSGLHGSTEGRREGGREWGKGKGRKSTRLGNPKIEFKEKQMNQTVFQTNNKVTQKEEGEKNKTKQNQAKEHMNTLGLYVLRLKAKELKQFRGQQF